VGWIDARSLSHRQDKTAPSTQRAAERQHLEPTRGSKLSCQLPSCEWLCVRGTVTRQTDCVMILRGGGGSERYRGVDDGPCLLIEQPLICDRGGGVRWAAEVERRGKGHLLGVLVEL